MKKLLLPLFFALFVMGCDDVVIQD